MIKSPLRYPGGKSRAVELIHSLVPSFQEFREPFVGGGSVFVNLKQRYPNKHYWINDLYFELYKFWEITQTNIDKLIDEINKFRNRFSDGKELHRFLIENKKNFNDIETAASFFIFNRITFSGTTESGGFSNHAYHDRFTESSIVRLKLLAEILPNTKITNFDYQEVVERDGDNVFIFLDPPYYSATKSALYGKNGNLHKQFDHQRFADVMKNCEHSWLITYDDSEYIRELFDFAYISNFNLVYGMRNVNNSKNGTNQKASEIFISNYNKNNDKYKLSNHQASLFA